jgi:hypothetical protein
MEALVPQALAKLLYPLDKSNFDPLRLLHFLPLRFWRCGSYLAIGEG